MTLSFGSGTPQIPINGNIWFAGKSQQPVQKARFGANTQESLQNDTFVSTSQPQPAQAAAKVHKTSALSLLAAGILGAAVAPVNYMLNKMDKSDNSVD